MSKTILQAPWDSVVRENTGIHLFWKIFTIVALAMILILRAQITGGGAEFLLTKGGLVLLLALFVSALAWVLMFPNWRTVEEHFRFHTVKVSRVDGWIHFDLPSKSYRLPEFLVRTRQLDETAITSIRFPLSIFYFYSRFPTTISVDNTQNNEESESGRREVLTPAPHTTGHTDP